MSDLWSSNLVAKRIPGFPYPEYFCRFCDQPMKLARVVHVHEAEELFKAIYICLNPGCEAFDEPARKAYMKVYYSDPLALERLETFAFKFKRKDLDQPNYTEVF